MAATRALGASIQSAPGGMSSYGKELLSERATAVPSERYIMEVVNQRCRVTCQFATRLLEQIYTGILRIHGIAHIDYKLVSF